MSDQYNQIKATIAVTKASLKSMMKSPSAAIFSFAFPLVFIVGFLFFNDGNTIKYTLGVTDSQLLLQPEIKTLEQYPNLNIAYQKDSTLITKSLEQATWDAEITQAEYNTISLKYAPHRSNDHGVLDALIKDAFNNSNISIKGSIAPVKAFKPIDFILPGQLGFAILAASVFGTAFLFYNLRQTLVLKRFFATPLNKGNIIIAETLARTVLQISAALFLILIGHYVFDFTLVNDWVTVINMLIMCTLALFTFLSYGFIISGLANTTSTIPPLSNMITLPQFILCGAFMPVDRLPEWIQVISNCLPLTHFINAMRKISFDGYNIWDVRLEIGVLILWGIISFLAARKTFKWE